MLIGADFFLTQRIFVSNATRSMYLTYEGGTVFGLIPKGARAAEGVSVDLTDRTTAPTDAEGFSRHGAVTASRNRLKEALAELDKVCTMATNEPRYSRQRAMARLASRQMLPALADLDQALMLAAADADSRTLRAPLRLGGGDPDGAKVDFEAANAALAPSSNTRMALAGLYNRVEMPEAALTN